MERVETTCEYNDDDKPTLVVTERTYLAADGWWVTETTRTETTYDTRGNLVREVETFGVNKADPIPGPAHLHAQGENSE